MSPNARRLLIAAIEHYVDAMGRVAELVDENGQADIVNDIGVLQAVRNDLVRGRWSADDQVSSAC